MIVYFGSVILVSLFALILYSTGYRQRFARQILLLAIFLQLFFVAALRSESVGVDTIAYVDIFSRVRDYNGPELSKVHAAELGYLLYNKLLSFFFYSPQALIVANSLILAFLFTLWVSRYSTNVWLSWFMFLTTFMYYTSFNISRQYIAIFVLANSFVFIFKQQILPFILLVFLASQFHSTALVFLPVFFLWKFSPSIKVQIAIYSLAFIFANILIEAAFSLFPFYMKYLGRSFAEPVGFPVLYLFLTAIALVVGISTKMKSREYLFLLNFAFLSLVMGFLATKIGMFSRIGYYFSVGYLLLIPLVMKRLNGRTERTVVYMVLCVLLLMLNYKQLNSGRAGVVPYKSCLSNHTF